MTPKSAPPVVNPVFAAMLTHAGLPQPVPEYRFHPERKWRWDYAWDGYHASRTIGETTWEYYFAGKLALEVQGGLFVNGRHSRGAALLKEHEKLNEAAALGWRVLFCTPQTLCHLSTIDLIRRALEVG